MTGSRYRRKSGTTPSVTPVAMIVASHAERVRVKSSPRTQRNRAVPASSRFLPVQLPSAITEVIAHM